MEPKYNICRCEAKHQFWCDEIEIFGPSKKRLKQEQKARAKLMLALAEQKALFAKRKKDREEARAKQTPEDKAKFDKWWAENVLA